MIFATTDYEFWEMHMSFEGRTALVTGASAGIGRAVSLALAREGANLALVARSVEPLEQVGRACGGALALAGDVADPDFVTAAVARTADRFGGIDLIICNAGISMNAAFQDTELHVFRRLIDVNYFGSLYFAHAGRPWLEESGGSLLFVSSIVGKRGFPTRSGYAASKFAVHGLFESLRAEWAGRGVHVGLVAPGYTDTAIRQNALGANGAATESESTTVGRVDSPEHVAEIMLEAVRQRRREVVVGTPGKAVVWLNRLLPGLADRVAARAMR